MESQSIGAINNNHMLKYYIKNSDKKQEVKVGDKIHVSVPTSTPYGATVCEIDVVVTQESLRQLIKDNIVVAIEDCPKPNPDDYKPFVRRLARRNDITFDDALEFLDILKETSLYAHNALLVELMAHVMNRGKNTPKRIYKVTPDGAIFTFSSVSNKNFPIFYSLEDAQEAVKLLRPFLGNNGK